MASLTERPLSQLLGQNRTVSRRPQSCQELVRHRRQHRHPVGPNALCDHLLQFVIGITRDPIGTRRQIRGYRSAPRSTELKAASKGLEFRTVAVVASDESVLPLAVRVADEVIATERQLLYVAATRARDRLFVSGIAPGSEVLGDSIRFSD